MSPTPADSTAPAPTFTEMNKSNARCFDKSIYLCHPGIIVGIIYAIVIGSAFIYYIYVFVRNSKEWRDELAYKIWRMKTRMRSGRRSKGMANSYNPKKDVELATVDIDNTPEGPEPALASYKDNPRADKDTMSAPQTGDKHVENQNDTTKSPADRDLEHDGAPVAATKSHHVHFGNPP